MGTANIKSIHQFFNMLIIKNVLSFLLALQARQELDITGGHHVHDGLAGHSGLDGYAGHSIVNNSRDNLVFYLTHSLV